jgi:hypothetical protein
MVRKYVNWFKFFQATTFVSNGTDFVELKTSGLSSNLSDHCLVVLTNDSDSSTIDPDLMIFGGRIDGAITDRVFRLSNKNNSTWADEPKMSLPRFSQKCGLIKKGNSFFPIIVGGIAGGNYSKSVDIFDLEKNMWTPGPEFPVEICCGNLVEDKSGGVYYVGGQSAGIVFY